MMPPAGPPPLSYLRVVDIMRRCEYLEYLNGGGFVVFMPLRGVFEDAVIFDISRGTVSEEMLLLACAGGGISRDLVIDGIAQTQGVDTAGATS